MSLFLEASRILQLHSGLRQHDCGYTVYSKTWSRPTETAMGQKSRQPSEGFF